jgi:hypothetical protein
MKRQDLRIAARMARRYADARDEIRTGKISKEMQEQFSPDHLKDICAHVGLPRESGEELLAAAIALDTELRETGARPPDPKPSELRDEINTIRNAAQNLETHLRDASNATRDACTVYTHEEDGAGNYIVEVAEDPFKAALPALLQLIQHLDNADLPTGEKGPPISPKRHSLGVLMDIVNQTTGQCSKHDLEYLAQHVLEPVLPNVDPPRWRELIASILVEKANRATGG